jgi:DNA (cytosine-5)-methyltransferase 1
MRKPILYDTYCCAGGATRGYQEAGFEVWGIDNRPQPRYIGDRFIQMDALKFIAACQAGEYPMPDIWHASPPCQRYSRGSKQSHTGHLHPDLIAATRDALRATGRPYVIENVADAGGVLRASLMLCGAMFPGLKTYRHRLFESSVFLPSLSHPPHLVKTPRSNVYVDGQFMTVYGHVSPTEKAREVMGIDWPMSQAEVVEAIPPAYTRYVGAHLLAWLALERAS